MKLNEYLRRDLRFFLYNVDDNEIHLVVERPGKSNLLVEIKSSTTRDEQEARKFLALSKPFGDCERVILYRGEERIVLEQNGTERSCCAVVSRNDEDLL